MDLKNINNVKLGIIGCGKMASAIIEGVINKNFLNPQNITVFDINPNAASILANKFGFSISDSIDDLLNYSNTLLLATKPFVIDDVLSQINTRYNNQLVMSILAGVKIQKYLSVINNIKIVRIMPNTPALVNSAMSAICPNANISADERDFVYNFMKNCGEVIISSEDKMDIITALSGSGPAFYYKIISLMANSAFKLGLDYNDALLLSAQTALGSAKMIMENNFDIEQLIKNVTTPGGCTEVGNNVLNKSDIGDILDNVIKDTMQKAHDLG